MGHPAGTELSTNLIFDNFASNGCLIRVVTAGLGFDEQFLCLTK
jgi:hypothetical protein